MRKRQAVALFLIGAVGAWIAAYVPEMWHRHQVLDALDDPVPRWVCVINGDAVSSQYEGYITKKYIMLGGQRFYSDDFKKWGRSADFMLVVIDDNQFMRWMRLDLAETNEFARAYGIARAGCRRMEAGTTASNLVVPVTPPIYNRVYQGPNTGPGTTTVVPAQGVTGSSAPYEGGTGGQGSGSFDWKRAVGPALGPAGGSSSPAAPATSGSSGTGAPAPSTGGMPGN